MKIKRFVSVFLLCACLAGLLLTPAASAAEVPDIQAKAALLADVNTDAVAYGKNIHEKNYPASLTKVMTALLVLERASGDEALLSEPVTASESAFSDTYYHVDGSSAGIKAGEILTVRELLERGNPIHPDTVAAYNEIVLARNAAQGGLSDEK